MARVSQLPRAETRKLLTNQRILGTSRQQLIRQRLLPRDTGHRGIMAELTVCFRLQISCFVFKRRPLKFEPCLKRCQISHLTD